MKEFKSIITDRIIAIDSSDPVGVRICMGSNATFAHDTIREITDHLNEIVSPWRTVGEEGKRPEDGEKYLLRPMGSPKTPIIVTYDQGHWKSEGYNGKAWDSDKYLKIPK